MSAEILNILGAALLSGIISPILLSFFNHNFIWRRQKAFELKHGVFELVVDALSAYESDALNPQLQKNKTQYKDAFRKIELRSETTELLEKANSMAESFFEQETYKLINETLKVAVSIESIPNTEFHKRRIKAIVAMAKELGIKS